MSDEVKLPPLLCMTVNKTDLSKSEYRVSYTPKVKLVQPNIKLASSFMYRRPPDYVRGQPRQSFLPGFVPAVRYGGLGDYVFLHNNAFYYGTKERRRYFTIRPDWISEREVRKNNPFSWSIRLFNTGIFRFFCVYRTFQTDDGPSRYSTLIYTCSLVRCLILWSLALLGCFCLVRLTRCFKWSICTAVKSLVCTQRQYSLEVGKTNSNRLMSRSRLKMHVYVSMSSTKAWAYQCKIKRKDAISLNNLCLVE